MDSKLHKTCQLALAIWGHEAQTDMMLEEAGELIVVLQRVKRGRAGAADVIDELADVAIMLKQMSLIHGEGAVAARIEEKRQRLERRIEQHRSIERGPPS